MRIGILNSSAWRFRIRTLLLIVAVVAVAIEGTRDGLRWARYRKLAKCWREQESYQRIAAHEKDSIASLRSDESQAAVGEEAIVLRNLAEKARRAALDGHDLADWAGQLATKYEQAQVNPWREAMPDVPFQSRASFGDPGPE